MTKETKNSDYPEGGVYELFAYGTKLSAYLNSSDMNELNDIGLRAKKEVIK